MKTWINRECGLGLEYFPAGLNAAIKGLELLANSGARFQKYAKKSSWRALFGANFNQIQLFFLCVIRRNQGFELHVARFQKLSPKKLAQHWQPRRKHCEKSSPAARRHMQITWAQFHLTQIGHDPFSGPELSLFGHEGMFCRSCIFNTLSETSQYISFKEGLTLSAAWAALSSPTLSMFVTFRPEGAKVQQARCEILSGRVQQRA